EPIEAKRDSGWYVLRKSLKRHRAATGAAAAFLILLMAAAVVTFTLYRQAEQQRKQAVVAQRRAEQQAARAGSIEQFLRNMLTSVNPDAAPGADPTLVLHLVDDAAK